MVEREALARAQAYLGRAWARSDSAQKIGNQELRQVCIQEAKPVRLAKRGSTWRRIRDQRKS